MAQPIPGYQTTIEIKQVGDGPKIEKGDRATVHATGVIKETGKKFWSTHDPGQSPFTYQAGVGQVRTVWPAVRTGCGVWWRACALLLLTCARPPPLPCDACSQVITGWDQGCLGMKVGEHRELIIPAKEGYGEAGFPAWGIPPGGTLVFTLECVQVSKN